jgi:DNA-directed RNA polymerase II subunit RPB2
MKIGKYLAKVRHEQNGNEQMVNPYNGRVFTESIFIGPIYYQRLRHLVEDKMYCRTRGAVSALTRQPMKGRTKDGGLRFGEMERDCILSHGLTEVLK